MKAAALTALLLFAITSQGQNSETLPHVRVPDEAAAIRIAEPALKKVYGKKQIESEKPLKAELRDGVWHVYGTLCCRNLKGERTCEGVCAGGVAQAQIRQRDGKVLKIEHPE